MIVACTRCTRASCPEDCRYVSVKEEMDPNRKRILDELLDVVYPYFTEEGSEGRKAEEASRRKVALGYSDHDTETLQVILEKCRESEEKKAREEEEARKYAFV